MGNPLIEVQQCGQSIWYDNIRRGLITSGEIHKLIEDGILGVTSNPTIFEKAIGGSTDYLEALKKLVRSGVKHTAPIYEKLVVEDIQMAADNFKSVYEKTHRRDGYISVEVSPLLSHDTKGSIAEARRLWKLINRPNIMIKIPGTPAGIPAVEELIYEGLNINITLIFSQEQYKSVAQAYIRGLTKRAMEHKPIDTIASVASVFVSRIDTAIDKILEQKINAAPSDTEKSRFSSLLGKAAIANAKITYQLFKDNFNTEVFNQLKSKGAMVQRPLWASTGTKNPAYPDTLYIDELIGPDTVNTIPPATLDAFREHGHVAPKLEKDVHLAQNDLHHLEEAGINLTAVYNQLLKEGLEAFSNSFKTLEATIRSKKQSILQKIEQRQTGSLGKYKNSVSETAASFQKHDFVRRFWAKDPILWNWNADEAHTKVIKNRMGWLTVVELMNEHADMLVLFADEVRKAKISHVVLLGMGGSSLCPDVCRATFGSKKGFPKLIVLDSTDPDAIQAVEKQINPAKTLFIVASKSGTTTESQVFFQYFYEKVKAGIKAGADAGKNFIAITDGGTPLEAMGKAKNFRHVFVNPGDIGGRYSALSYFGLVPMALIGIDIHQLLERAERMMHATASCVPVEESPAVLLGIMLGELAKAGRNKATFVCSPAINTFGYWVEQLIAESTGKMGKGIVPVEGETLGAPKVYQNDRVFIYLKVGKKKEPAIENKLKALEKAGHPVIRIRNEDKYDLGDLFLRWEIATAVAGSVLGIDPFDEPNVKESKDNTNRVLGEFKSSGKLPEEKPVMEEKGIKLFCDPELFNSIRSQMKGKQDLSNFFTAFFNQVKPNDYIALMAYVQMNPVHIKAMQKIRMKLASAKRTATTLGFGPRFLHSTGQLHKGGAANGVFVQITAERGTDLTIPGEKFTFGILKASQSAGDFISLTSRKYRAVRIHLGKNVGKDLATLAKMI